MILGLPIFTSGQMDVLEWKKGSIQGSINLSPGQLRVKLVRGGHTGPQTEPKLPDLAHSGFNLQRAGGEGHTRRSYLSI